MTDYFICPHCGAKVDVGAPACPECGSDDETGWSDETAYDGFYLDDDEPLPEPVAARTYTRTILTLLMILTLAAVLMGRLPGGIYWIPALLLGIGLAYYATTIRPNTRPQREKRLYQDLLLKARGDIDMVERWLEYERQFSPQANRMELMEDALRRWQRDNR